MVDALVTGEVLRWARQRAGASIDAVADRLHVRPETVREWEGNVSHPSFAKARNLANFLRVPFGYLFLDRPPQEALTVRDLRRFADDIAVPLGADFIAIHQDACAKQAWYRERLILNGAAPRSFVGSFTRGNNPVAVAKSIRDVLGPPAAWRRAGDWAAMFRELVHEIEEAGILVLRNGLVGTDIPRRLSLSEFSGFALSDAYAPLVFINPTDAADAQIFSLAHELAHIWIGVSAVSNFNLSSMGEGYDPIEVFCRAVAAEVLVSRAEFHECWKANRPLARNVDALSSKFKVGTQIIAHRALDLGRIDRDTFQAFVRASEVRKKPAQDDRDEGWAKSCALAVQRNSPTLARAVLLEAFEGRLLLREAGQLLSVNPSQLRDLAKQLG